MKASTIDTASFTVKGIRQATYLADSIGPVSDSDFFTYYIADSLLTNDTVTVTLKSSITDTGNIPLSGDYVWNFYTLVPETVKPYLASSIPVNNSANVKVNSSITINFSEQIDTMTVDSVSDQRFGTSHIPLSVGFCQVQNDGASVVFYPKDSLCYRDTVTVMIQAPLADYSGNQIVDTSFNFSTKLSPTVPI